MANTKDVKITVDFCIGLLLNHLVFLLDVPSPFRDIERRRGGGGKIRWFDGESSLAGGHAIADGRRR